MYNYVVLMRKVVYGSSMVLHHCPIKTLLGLDGRDDPSCGEREGVRVAKGVIVVRGEEGRRNKSTKMKIMVCMSVCTCIRVSV